MKGPGCVSLVGSVHLLCSALLCYGALQQAILHGAMLPMLWVWYVMFSHDGVQLCVA